MTSEALSLDRLESAEGVEFTLQDTYDYLKEIQKEKQNEIDELTEAIKNNAVCTLGPNTSFEDILAKQLQILESLEKLVLEEDPKNFPIPKTDDMYITALQGLEDEVQNMNSLLNGMQNELSSLKSDVAYLEDEKSGFEKMKEAALNAAEVEAKNTYEEEYAITKRLFSEVKSDLATVVDKLFPNNDGLHAFLVQLSKAQQKGGDDVYLKIDQRNIYYTNFLELTGIITYHPNDKNMCKMVNFL